MIVKGGRFLDDRWLCVRKNSFDRHLIYQKLCWRKMAVGKVINKVPAILVGMAAACYTGHS